MRAHNSVERTHADPLHVIRRIVALQIRASMGYMLTQVLYRDFTLEFLPFYDCLLRV